MIRKKFLNVCKMDELCKAEMEKFLHQNFYESLMSMKKNLFVNFWLMQTRKLAFFEEIGFISRTIWENSSNILFFRNLKLHDLLLYQDH